MDIKQTIENIFSLKNTKTHKVITLLGIKIKLKSYRIMYRNLDKTCQKLKEKNERYLNALKTNPDMYEIYVKNPELEQKDNIKTPVNRAELNEMLKLKEFPLFFLVEIETMNRCNGECAFCPVNRFYDKREFKKMDEETFYSIINQLAELKYDGRVALYSNNEPLMDDRIYDFANYARTKLPKAHIYIITNGTLLDIDKFNKLIPNLDTMIIDAYYSDYAQIPENIKPIAEECLKNPELQSKVKIQFIDRNAIRNTRGGNAKNRKNVYEVKSPCHLPFTQIVFRSEGKVSLCCNDATGEFTMGDVTKERIIDIWHGEKYAEIRNLMKDTRSNIEKCRRCDSFDGCIDGNMHKDRLFTKKQFLSSWEKIKTMLEETSQIPPPDKKNKI